MNKQLQHDLISLKQIVERIKKQELNCLKHIKLLFLIIALLSGVDVFSQSYTPISKG